MRFLKIVVGIGLVGMVLAGGAWLLAPGEPSPEARAVPKPATRPNLLVIVLDDVGMAKADGNGVPDMGMPTPNLDALAARGLRFDRAWTHPSCSPTRAALLTGRLPFRYGLGQAIARDGPYALPLGEVTLAEALAPVGYTSVVLGKWHLIGHDAENAGQHPLDQGFAHHRGTIANLPFSADNTSYTRWSKSIDGQATESTTYATTDTTNDAIEAVRTLNGPWLLWVAYNAIHTPLHVPPASLVKQVPPANAPDHVLASAMMEALDHEIGRLLAEVKRRDDTWVVVLGDNGFSADALAPPLQALHPLGNKGAVTEGGTRVPWMVWGPGLQRGARTEALVQDVDLFPTLLDLAGVPPSDPSRTNLDGISFAPVLRNPKHSGHRREVVIRVDRPNGPEPTASVGMVTDGERKLVFRETGAPRPYDLTLAWPEGGKAVSDLHGPYATTFRRFQRVWKDLGPRDGP